MIKKNNPTWKFYFIVSCLEKALCSSVTCCQMVRIWYQTLSPSLTARKLESSVKLTGINRELSGAGGGDSTLLTSLTPIAISLCF